MTDQSEYVPPKVWIAPDSSGGKFANINRPTARDVQSGDYLRWVEKNYTSRDTVQEEN